MKTLLRGWAVIAVLSLTSVFISKLNAQCVVSDIFVQKVIVPAVQNPGECTVTFDVSFTIENNNGNKYIFIHAWTEAMYPNYFQCVNGESTINGVIHAPEAADLNANGAPFLNIAINNNLPVPELLTEYTPDPSVPLTTVGSIEHQLLPDGSALFILKGVTVTLPVSCGTPTLLIADVWSSQSAAAQVAHCVNCGITYPAGHLSVTGSVNCSSLQFNASISNNTTNSIDGYFRLYADVNGDTYFTPATDTLITDTTHFTVGAGATVNVNGPIPSANVNQDIFMLMTQTSGPAAGTSAVVLLPSQLCAPLPVTLNTFTAARNRANVTLKWETTTEINNRGFALQRNLGNGNWQVLDFIESKAVNGNSNSLLTYTYNDFNPAKGITQYRLKQVDIDGAFKLSQIRAVRGEGQKGRTIIYPNPASGSKVNVVLEDVKGSFDVSLIDLNGRTIKEWRKLTSNSIVIDNLTPGIYNLRIIDRETGEQSVEKIMVIKN